MPPTHRTLPTGSKTFRSTVKTTPSTLFPLLSWTSHSTPEGIRLSTLLTCVQRFSFPNSSFPHSVFAVLIKYNDFLFQICNINDDTVFTGTELPDCSFMASDIQTCQAAGKIVTISIGGATGSVSFTGDDQAVTFANTIWDLFLGGSNDTRPFGDAILDGVDLDLEGGSPDYWPAFVTQIRTLADGANKTYYFTAAPQCVYPDAYVGDVINSVGFDAIYVQFYK